MSSDPDDGGDGGYFKDADQLNQMVSDERATDTRCVSSKDDAKAVVDGFRSSTAASPWGSLDRSEVADRLADLIDNPRLTQQGDLNLCGPASFMCIWNARDPVAFAKYATKLFDTGKGAIGRMTVSPSSDLMNQDYADMKTRMTNVVSPQADWMVLGALRNSTDVFWQGTFSGDPQQGLSAMTRPEEVASWLQAAGIYAKVSNEANWATIKGIPHASGLVQAEGTDIVFLINANMLKAAEGLTKDGSWIANQFPNHFVVLVNEVVPSADETTIQLSFWTWGDTMLNLKVPGKDFVDNYYGAIIARLPPAN
jgi:hypothetical protein